MEIAKFGQRHIRVLKKCVVNNFFSELDLIPYCITFVIGLTVSVEVSLIVGIVAHLGILLFRSSVPELVIEEREARTAIPYILVVPDRALFFPSVDDIRERLGQMAMAHVDKGQLPVVIDLDRVSKMDFTAAKVYHICKYNYELLDRPTTYVSSAGFMRPLQADARRGSGDVLLWCPEKRCEDAPRR